eukprot:Hpha_TRINITY_DN14792_c0_g4::TRINITY_DN14792_c0_g4_i1::g.102607::m.102607
MLEGAEFQSDLDSVDEAATFQYWLHSHTDPSLKDTALRRAVKEQLDWVVEERIVTLVRERFGSDLVPCFNFIRRYNSSERLKHPLHFDIRSYATFVVSLNSAGKDFEGGLYVAQEESGGAAERRFLGMEAGDGVVHQSDLLHGVEVLSGTRWSWILWFKKGSCDSDPAGWHREGAEKGNAIHQFLLAYRTHSPRGKEKWLRRSAKGGYYRAMNEIGAILTQSPGRSGAEQREGEKWLKKARPHHSQAAYNLGLWYLNGGDERGATELFEEACNRGCDDGCINLAIAVFNGKGGQAQDTERAVGLLDRLDSAESTFLAYKMSQNQGSLERASTLGNPEAQHTLASKMISEGDHKGAMSLLRKAAANGHGESQELLARLASFDSSHEGEL